MFLENLKIVIGLTFEYTFRRRDGDSNVLL
jgi:hypothetical protein